MAGEVLPSDEDWIRQAHVDLDGFWEVATFRLYQAYDVVVGPNWRLDLAAQPFGEVWLIRKGVCAITLGDQQAVAGPGDVAVLRPGPARLSANGGDEPLSLLGFGCGVMLFDAIDLLGQLELPLVVTEASPRLRRLIRGTVNATRRGRTDRVFRARANAELALAEIVGVTGIELPSDDGSNPDPLPRMRSEVRAAVAYIAENYAEPLELATIAGAVHLSPKYLARCFRESLGIPPMAYVRRYRLNRAREQLLTSDLSITHIAAHTGFRELAHFSRAFRSLFGVSPRILRDHARALRSSNGYVEANTPDPLGHRVK